MPFQTPASLPPAFMHGAGLYSNCLGDPALEDKSGESIASPGAKNALKTASSDELPTGQDIMDLPAPYSSDKCASGAKLSTAPFSFAVFCNGDGTVAVSFWVL